MKFHVLTLFPELIVEALAHGVVGQAVRDQRVQLEVSNPRAQASGVHQAVDDRPFGGGDGMVMSPEVAAKALEAVGLPRAGVRLVYPSARGRPFDDGVARSWAKDESIAFFCGRYGGVDQRLIEAFGMEEVALGDFVLSGGELAALAMIDAVARFVPGVLGNAASPDSESFAAGLLEEPQFTRPREWRGLLAPDALLSGDHARIARWKAELALLATAGARPDLLVAWRERAGDDGCAKMARAALARLDAMSEAERRACGLRDADAIRARLVGIAAPGKDGEG